MTTKTPQDPPMPPHSPDDELDIDLDEPDTPESVEELGTYPSIEAYLRRQLEDLVDRSIDWILDHLDYGEVLKRFESNGSRYYVERGRVYKRGGITTPPDRFGP